jgi:hypothetical protein
MKKSTILYICVVFGFASCIEPYASFDIPKNRNILVVQGLLTTDIQKPDTIKIQYSTYNGETTIPSPIASAKASVLDITTNQETVLIEYGKGNFLPPNNFRINSNDKYVLKLTLPNGQQYQSSQQQLVIAPPIDKAYDVFNPKSQQSDDGQKAIPGNDVYVDFKDKANERNFYLWRSIHYESVDYCVSCSFESLYYDFFIDTKTGKQYLNQCIKRANIESSFITGPPYAAYDYICGGIGCYNIYRNKNIVIFSDIASNGLLVKGIKIAQVPNYSIKGCLVVIQQMSISDEVFRFYKLLESQVQKTGTLADTPPEAIVGNIRNITNPLEQVVGVFGLASIQEKRHWIDRKTAPEPRVLILGRKPNPEPKTAFRPPPAPCEESPTRTGIKPEGWRD